VKTRKKQSEDQKKAKELIELFGHKVQATKCVEEIIKEYELINPLRPLSIEFWTKVREEITKY